MRHGMANRKLGRTSSHRKAMFRNQLASLIESERIITTLPKAKELRPIAEKLITLAKNDIVHNRRHAARQVPDDSLIAKLFDTLGPRFSTRPGGYTRIMKLGARPGRRKPRLACAGTPAPEGRAPLHKTAVSFALMKRSLALLFTLFAFANVGAAAFSGTATAEAAVATNDEAAKLHALFDRTWEAQLREDPLYATSVGRHDYDNLLPSVTPADLEGSYERT